MKTLIHGGCIPGLSLLALSMFATDARAQFALERGTNVTYQEWSGELREQDYLTNAAGEIETRLFHYFNGERGQTVQLDVQSTGTTNDFFNPYLKLQTGGENDDARRTIAENNDYAGSEHFHPTYEDYNLESRVTAELPQSGAYTAWVLAPEYGTGPYTLRLHTAESNNSGNLILVSGSLSELDPKYDAEAGPAVHDVYTFSGRRGEKMTLILSSDDFDTYLKVIPPNADAQFNDDHDGTNSQLDLTLSETGEYTVVVSNHDDNLATGDYNLLIVFE